MSEEAKPLEPGTYYGELSPQEEWFWDGTGRPEDQWIVNPSVVTNPEPEPLAAPNLSAAHVKMLPPMDYANPTKYNLPAPPAGVTWWYLANCWARHDIIRVAGLT